MHNKVIYAAIAAPGAGKTQALIEQLPKMISQGQKVIMAVPTLALVNEIGCRLENGFIVAKIISSDNCEVSVSMDLESALKNDNINTMAVTHEALRLSNPSLLEGWTLIFDETPQVLELTNSELDSIELNRIAQETQNDSGRLHLISKRKTAVREQVSKYTSGIFKSSCQSTLSHFEYQVFDALLEGHQVFIDPANKHGRHWVRVIKEYDYSKHFMAAREVHILAANVESGLFGYYCKKKFIFERSYLTPKFSGYKAKITIYPLMKGKWSKARALRDFSGADYTYHKGDGTQVIDKVMETATSDLVGEKALVFSNKWAKWREKNKNLEHCNLDSRGLNSFSSFKAVILLFGGNPSPCDKRSLSKLASDHNVNFGDLLAAWMHTKKHDVCLQAVTRSAIRVVDEAPDVKLYVQDSDAADYLKSSFLTNANIDLKLANEYSYEPQGSNRLKAARRMAVQLIFGGESKKNVVNILEKVGISRATAYRWLKTSNPTAFSPIISP